MLASLSRCRELVVEEIPGAQLSEDLFYRLSAHEIQLPPLRDRRSDIPHLVEHFRIRTESRLARKGLPGPSSETLRLLKSHDWPGNVRELENPVQLALIDFGTLSDVDGIGSLLSSPSEDAQSSPKLPAFGDDLTIEEAERLHIEAALQRCECNKTRAASILGVERKSLYRKLKRFGVEVDDESIEG